MSAEEMRDYCRSLSSFQVRVQIRLKNCTEILLGRIGLVDTEGFQLVFDDKTVQSLNYAWVARIKSA